MEQIWWLFFLSASLLRLAPKLVLGIHKQARRYENLPPSPPSFPIIGHLHLIKELIHRSLQELSDKYGPILKLSFGKVRVMLVSSPSAVEECFSKNDVVFANRPRLHSVKYLSYDYTTVVSAPYGPHWRNLRRLLTLEIFSTIPLNMFLGNRQDEVRLLLKNLYHQSSNGIKAKVEMRPKLSELSFNIIMRMVSGKRYFGLLPGDDAEEAKRFREIINEFF